MIEGAQQLDMFGQQHTIAEHVARHITDTDDREVFFLDILVDFTEVTFDRFPGAPGRNAHFFVIVTNGAA